MPLCSVQTTNNGYDYQHLATIVCYYAVLVFSVAGPEYTEITTAYWTRYT